MDSLAYQKWWRTWQAAISLGEAHAAFEPKISECDFAIYSERRSNAGNWNVLVPAGKEINWDSVSKSDWKQNRANWICCSNAVEMWCYKSVFWSLMCTLSSLEWDAEEGDSPVRKTERTLTNSWVLYLGNDARNRGTSTSNPKYKSRPIEYSTVRERWKELLTES